MDTPVPVPPSGPTVAVGPPFEPLTSLSASLFADMPAVELGDAAAAPNLFPGPPTRAAVDIAELYAATNATAGADPRADPQWQGSLFGAFAGQLASGHHTHTRETRSVPRGHTRPPGRR